MFLNRVAAVLDELTFDSANGSGSSWCSRPCSINSLQIWAQGTNHLHPVYTFFCNKYLLYGTREVGQAG